jgi:protein SYS1
MRAALPVSVRRLCSVSDFTPFEWHAGMIMDWREMAGRPTVRGLQGEGSRWSSYAGAWSGGKKVDYHNSWAQDRWEGPTDPMRGWIIAFCWIVACSAE